MISRYHRVIFVHVPKCAGQSIERAFLRDMGLEWDARSPLLLRSRQDGERGPERLAHLYAWEYVKFDYISKAEFAHFFKFSVVRDPIDRIISELNWREVQKGIAGVNSIEEYVTKAGNAYPADSDIVRHLEPQINFLFDERKECLLVDSVIKLEGLKRQFEAIKSELGSTNLELRHENVPKLKIWNRQELTSADIEFLQDTYRADYDFLTTFGQGAVWSNSRKENRSLC